MNYSKNYFDLLGLEHKYDLSMLDLKKQYFLMQNRYHPDKTKNQDEKAIFLNISMKLNEAYKTLQDDYLRAEYLLKLHGMAFDDNFLKNALSKEELEQIFSEFEILAEIDDKLSLEKMQNAKLNDKLKVIEEIKFSFVNNKLNDALDLTVRLKYLTNLLSIITMKIKHADH
jgi:molecular chaperone HscB